VITSRRLLLSLVVVVVSGCAARTRFRATGELAGQTVDTTVDSAAAAEYLGKGPRRSDTTSESEVTRAVEDCEADPDDPWAMECLGQRVSPDFATIDFVAKLYDRPANKRAQDEFHALVERIGSADASGTAAAPAAFRRYVIAFVPGYAYKKNADSGADFAAQRRLLGKKGFRTVLIPTDQAGSVEDNARIVAGGLNRLAESEPKILVVSASKGGPEVARALAEGLSTKAAARVKAWISVGGLLRGSPYADRFLKGHRRFFAKLGLAFNGLSPIVLDDLSTDVRRPAFDSLRLPLGLLTVQYVGAPLSGHLSKRSRHRYELVRSQGPNDGLTLLSDELIEGGVVVTDVGLDHYFRDPEIDLKTVALAYLVLERLEGKTTPSS